jgi:V/A-type H+-transporting ATPase subunit E
MATVVLAHASFSASFVYFIMVEQLRKLEIETEAQKKARAIIEEAQTQASQLIARAQEECQKMTQATQTTLKQAGRDMLLELRREIKRTLEQVMLLDISEALSPERLSHILEVLIRKFTEHTSDHPDIRIMLSSSDLEKLKKGFIEKLKHELRKPLEFRPSEDIQAGFMISFDGGKSSFDFTDVSLAEYLSSFLNSEIASLLKEAAGE